MIANANAGSIDNVSTVLPMKFSSLMVAVNSYSPTFIGPSVEPSNVNQLLSPSGVVDTNGNF